MNPKGIDNPPTKRSPKNSQRQHGPILGPSLNKLWLRGNFLQGPFACMGKYPTSSCVILKVFHFAISFGCMSSVMSRLSIHLLNVNHSWHLDIYIYIHMVANPNFHRQDCEMSYTCMTGGTLLQLVRLQ